MLSVVETMLAAGWVSLSKGTVLFNLEMDSASPCKGLVKRAPPSHTLPRSCDHPTALIPGRSAHSRPEVVTVVASHASSPPKYLPAVTHQARIVFVGQMQMNETKESHFTRKKKKRGHCCCRIKTSGINVFFHVFFRLPRLTHLTFTTARFHDNLINV